MPFTIDRQIIYFIMKQKTYIFPTMRVAKMPTRSSILAGSAKANSVSDREDYKVDNSNPFAE